MRSGERNSWAPSAAERRSPRSILSAIGNNAASRMRPRFNSTRGGMSALEALDGQRHVVAAEPEAVGQRGSHVALGRLVGCVVEIQLRIRSLVVDRRRNDVLA